MLLLRSVVRVSRQIGMPDMNAEPAICSKREAVLSLVVMVNEPSRFLTIFSKYPGAAVNVPPAPSWYLVTRPSPPTWNTWPRTLYRNAFSVCVQPMPVTVPKRAREVSAL